MSTYRIAEVIRVDRANVRRALIELERLEILEIQRGGTDRGGQKQLTLIGFGPGSLRTPVPGSISTKDRGLFRPKTGVSRNPHQSLPGLPGGAGTARPSAGASGARAERLTRFVEAWDLSEHELLTESTVERMAKESGIAVDELFEVGLVSTYNSMIRLDNAAAARYRPMSPERFADQFPDVRHASTMHDRAIQAGHDEEFARASAAAWTASHSEHLEEAS